MERVKSRGMRDDAKLFSYDKVEKFWEWINELIPKRKNAHVVKTENKSLEEIL